MWFESTPWHHPPAGVKACRGARLSQVRNGSLTPGFEGSIPFWASCYSLSMKPFLIQKIESAQKAGWCEECQELYQAGPDIAIVRYGPGKDSWGKCHVTCAEGSVFNIQNTSAPPPQEEIGNNFDDSGVVGLQRDALNFVDDHADSWIMVMKVSKGRRGKQWRYKLPV